MRPISVALAVLLAAASAFAQSNQGTITGTITDPAGAVVPGAQIEARNTETGVLFQGGSSGTGNYVLRVPAGTYELSVDVTGFKKFVEENVQVIVATDTRKDVALSVGSTTETLTVEASAPLLQTESGEQSNLVTVENLDTLPILVLSGGSVNGPTKLGSIRNPLSSTLLLPGAEFQNDRALVVNGLPSNSEGIRVEGQDAKGTIWTIAQQSGQQGVDAIQEVSVQTSNFAAEYGQVGGGYFNYTMKSGTNQLHGSVYDYFVNEALNAGLPFTNAGTTNSEKDNQHIRNPERRNDYGFTVGGPIRIPKVYDGRNKTFFFFNYEQFRETQNIQSGINTVPTLAYRTGDFSTAGCFQYSGNTCLKTPGNLTIGGAVATDPAGQTLQYGEIFDPNTTRIVNGAQVRSPFPNNIIPASRFDAVAAAIQNLLPLPNAPGIVNNYIVPNYSTYQHVTNYSWKLDHSISSTIKLSWYLSEIQTRNPGSNGFATSIGGATPMDNRNFTTRVNYDQTITPTVLFHLGIGYYQVWEPAFPAQFDQNSIGLHGYLDPNLFPTIGGLYNANSGGWAGPGQLLGALGGLGGFYQAQLWEEKPTANTNLTWVKGNHIFKFGGEYTGEGLPEEANYRANGNFTFSNAETADPWQNGQALNYPNGTGFSYASFLLGLPDTLALSQPTGTKMGNHLMGFYAQDSWKVTRTLTLDYGLRYDYQTYLRESYGRMPDASFSTPNPTVGGLLGATIFEGNGPGRCDCQFSHNYPFAFGPRLGVAYQATPKTVIRGGFGVVYDTMQTDAAMSYGVATYNTYNALGYGLTPVPNGLQGGNPYPNIVWPNFNPGQYPVETAGALPPGNPPIFYSNAARPPRIMQWSIGVQREVSKDIVVEAAYVGNRGVWFPAPLEDQIAANTLTPAILAAHGLSLSNPADRSLLTSLLSSPAAIAAGFGPAYPGMPLTQTVAQTLRPVPQWNNPTVDLGPPLGKTWYDSLQTKATKRFSHGFQAQASFTWQKGLVNGTGTDTANTFGSPLVNDMFNLGMNKELNQLVPPMVTVLSGTYLTPGIGGDSKTSRLLSQVVRDWEVGFLFRYQSGALIQSPPSNNQLFAELKRPGQTFWNYVPGVNPLAVNPNCGCFNPQTTQVLNPNAWTDAPAGTFGGSAPFYNAYRWQRQPAESMSFGREFRIGSEGKYTFMVRAEFQNIFNRLFLSMPAVGGTSAVNPATALSSAAGILTGGYGFLATAGGAGAVPRSGQLVGRFTF